MHGVSISKQVWLPFGAALIFAISPLVSYPSIAAASDIKATLAGDQEVPTERSADA